jgi:hypothetical protein
MFATADEQRDGFVSNYVGVSRGLERRLELGGGKGFEKGRSTEISKQEIP